LEGQATTSSGLAGRLGLSPAETASLLAALQARGEVSIVGDEVCLTPLGRQEAARLIRAHRLWERHLADDTGYRESEWHSLAEREEHRLSPAEADALARQLGQPASDPHGDPIPTADGDVVLHVGQPLSRLPLGAMARISHVEDEPAQVYDEIVAAGLAPGVIVQLLEAAPDGALLLANDGRHWLSPSAAENISVVPLPPHEQFERPRGEPLHALRPGQPARVLDLSPRCHGADRRRLLDLGITPGTAIEAVLTGPSGDPTAYRIRDALIALRREQADLVHIVRPEEPQA
jgi:DtxR family Mn-dependent transcriptional regulator